MSVDFQQVRQQVKLIGESAPGRQEEMRARREIAAGLLHECADQSDWLRERVLKAVRQGDPALRCAIPADPEVRPPESLNGGFSLPALPATLTVLAADGSQVLPDRHAEVSYGLINVGAIQMQYGQASAPVITIQSQLIYDEQLYTPQGGLMTEAMLALQRDLSERNMLFELAQSAYPPVITFTDGPMELWGAKDSQDGASFERSLQVYLGVLEQLDQLGVATAGYVDKPFANLVVRMLEAAMALEEDLQKIKDYHPLQGVTDLNIYWNLLGPGERSAVFGIQSKSAAEYRGRAALHFFYLNVGRENRPWLARVEIPAWVAGDQTMLDNLHAALVSQCQIMGSRPFPYLLHRAHEAAVVTQEEKAQVTQMIALELRKHGLEVGEISHKQAAKDSARRTRYTP